MTDHFNTQPFIQANCGGKPWKTMEKETKFRGFPWLPPKMPKWLLSISNCISYQSFHVISTIFDLHLFREKKLEFHSFHERNPVPVPLGSRMKCGPLGISPQRRITSWRCAKTSRPPRLLTVDRRGVSPLHHPPFVGDFPTKKNHPLWGQPWKTPKSSFIFVWNKATWLMGTYPMLSI